MVFAPLLLTGIVGCVSHDQSRDDSDESHHKIFAEWFGASTSHPYILIWAESGLVGLGILEQEQVEAMMAFEEFNEFSDAVGSAIERLLTGGFPILDEFDADKFLIATSIINFILDNLEIDVELLNAWNDLIQSDQ
jgi:hypothetical protein